VSTSGATASSRAQHKITYTVPVPARLPDYLHGCTGKLIFRNSRFFLIIPPPLNAGILGVPILKRCLWRPIGQRPPYNMILGLISHRTSRWPNKFFLFWKSLFYFLAVVSFFSLATLFPLYTNNNMNRTLTQTRFLFSKVFKCNKLVIIHLEAFAKLF